MTTDSKDRVDALIKALLDFPSPDIIASPQLKERFVRGVETSRRASVMAYREECRAEMRPAKYSEPLCVCGHARSKHRTDLEGEHFCEDSDHLGCQCTHYRAAG